jgi:hypothetical protein
MNEKSVCRHVKSRKMRFLYNFSLAFFFGFSYFRISAQNIFFSLVRPR